MRKCLVEEFSSLYIFHLRGNQRTVGEKSRQEGGKIFGSGSRSPIAISILVKNPEAEQQGQIYFHDIGDYLSREEKLEKITEFESLKGISNANGWISITPDEHGDWLNQRDNSFDAFLSIGDKKEKLSKTLFKDYSQWVLTSRDAWCFNYSKLNLSINIQKTINTFNGEAIKFRGVEKEQKTSLLKSLVTDSTLISWSSSLTSPRNCHVFHA